MFRKLLITLLSSWVVNPLGLLLVQANGLGSHDALKFYFLVIGASVPFQLLLNECYAATGGKNLRDPEVRWILFFVLSAQFTVAMLSSSGLEISDRATTAICLSSSAWMLISFFTANAFYERLRKGLVSNAESFVIGAAPGLISIILYVIFILGLDSVWLVWAPVALFVLPASFQWWVVRKPESFKASSSSIHQSKHFFKQRTLLMLLVIALLWVCSSMAADLKLNLSTLFPAYAVLFIYATNLIITLINVALKAAHLESQGQGARRVRATTWMSFSCALVLFVISPLGLSGVDALKLLASQAAIVCLLEFGRTQMSNRSLA
jgi:hypothetical protein